MDALLFSTPGVDTVCKGTGRRSTGRGCIGMVATGAIVFASSGNPVNPGLVASFARPRGNVTGFTISGPEPEGKRVQLLKDAVPQLSRVAVLWNSANPALFEFYQQTRAAAAALSLTLQPVVEVRHADDFENAFSTVASAKPHALLVIVDRFLIAHRMEIVNFAATNRQCRRGRRPARTRLVYRGPPGEPPAQSTRHVRRRE